MVEQRNHNPRVIGSSSVAAILKYSIKKPLMQKVIYLDVSIIRTLVDSPELITPKIYDNLVGKLGRIWICFPSYYLFFEYIAVSLKKH